MAMCVGEKMAEERSRLSLKVQVILVSLRFAIVRASSKRLKEVRDWGAIAINLLGRFGFVVDQCGRYCEERLVWKG